MSAKRILVTTATLALGSVAVVGCSGTSSASGATPSAASSAHRSSTAAAAPGTGTGTSNTDADATGTGAAGTAKTGTQKTATGNSHHTATAAASGTKRTPSCRAGQLTITAAPAARPLNHLLITARNTSAGPCDLGIIGLVTFDGRIKAATPDGLGGGPNILKPGQANYEGVSLDQQDAPGSGTHSSTLSVRLDNGETVRIPVKTYVHAPSITVWEPTAADALAS